MAKLSLEGMEFYAHHGYYEEETILGGYYVVDVYLETDIVKAAAKDDLSMAINYETIYMICKTVMSRPNKLIETVVERIALGVKHQYKNIKDITVRVRKKNPPLGGVVDQAVIEVKADFRKKCGRCDKPLLCYEDRTCWCLEPYLDKGRLENLKIQYGNKCLCKDCMSYYV